MQYVYNKGAMPPIDFERVRSLNDAAARLAHKIEALDIDNLPVSDWGKESVIVFRKATEETIKKYVHVLAWLLAPDANLRHEAFVDYGGGHGFLACLAKEAGFKGVVYNDIFDGCAKDAEALSKVLGCKADAYVCGDIAAVRRFFVGKQPASCAVASINVIEHIYDMDEFIDVASSFSTGPMTMVLSTSANPLNPLVRRRHFKQHREWEFTDGPHEGSYPMDTLRAFLSVRRDIVKETAPDLRDSDVDALAAATRGLRKQDIQNAVKTFQKTGRIPVQPDHPTNTCDPLTGSWQERLLNIEHVTQKLQTGGFEVKVLGGYYSGTAASPAKRAVKQLAASVLNQAISLLGPYGTRLSPCFMFQAFRPAAMKPAPSHRTPELVAGRN
ncbi:MAG TPA: hypothetical protein VLT36_14130 [Candidatus Dormibacteraeota bacterium]|nr:hypothetical protein [Candidatus Dormibacteraeota bacterium]